MFSIWEKESFNSFSDILIVGGGLTGLLTSILLKRKKPHLKIRLIEKGLHPEGASIKNAGFACFGSVSEILDDISSEGEDLAINRVLNRYKGLNKLLEIVGEDTIEAQHTGGNEVFTSNEEGMMEACIKALPNINNLLKGAFGNNVFQLRSNSFGFQTLNKTIHTPFEFSINSGLLVKRLIFLAQAEGVEIHFGCALKDFERTSNTWQAETSNGVFKTDQLVLATNGFTPSLLNDQPIVPGRGQIILTNPIPSLSFKGNFHLHQGYFYFRNYKGCVLLGGGRHLDRENEATSDQSTSELIQNKLEEVLRETILPGQHFTIQKRWAGTMAFGPNNEKEALVEKLDSNGLFLGARLGGMGVAMTSNLAERLSDLILD